jgi:ATP/ADP translocase
LKRGEGRPFAVLFLYYFCLVALTIAAKTARDAYFLSRYDRSLLPIMFGASAVAVGIAVAAYSGLANRLGGRRTLILTNGLFAVSLLLLQSRMAGVLIPIGYVWIEVITVIATLQFWLLAPDIFDPRSAKRLYGPITGGGSLGAIVSGLTLKPFVSTFGSGYLLYLVAGLLAGSGPAGADGVPVRQGVHGGCQTGTPDTGEETL